MMIKIELTDNAIREAFEYQSRVMNTPTMNNPNYTNISQKDRYAIGYLGEWAFNEYLLNNDVEGNWNPKSNGISDEADFFIQVNNELKTIDVKTGSNPNYRMLMFPEKQFLRSKKDYYVGVILNLENKKAYIHGYATKKEVEKIKPQDFGHNIPTLAIKLDKLREISEII